MIVSLEEVKTNLQITTTEYDTIITNLIPQVDAIMLRIRGIEYFTLEADGTNSTLSNITYSQVETARRRQMLESTYDDGTLLRSVIKYINKKTNVIELETAIATPFTKTIITVYPLGSQFIASKLVAFYMYKQDNNLTNENIGSYSYTKEETRDGIPISIYNSIEKYQSLKC